jgi:TolA-binding protein
MCICVQVAARLEKQLAETRLKVAQTEQEKDEMEDEIADLKEELERLKGSMEKDLMAKQFRFKGYNNNNNNRRTSTDYGSQNDGVSGRWGCQGDQLRRPQGEPAAPAGVRPAKEHQPPAQQQRGQHGLGGWVFEPRQEPGTPCLFHRTPLRISSLHSTHGQTNKQPCI